MTPPRFEDGTTGRPLGDDEDLDVGAYADVPEREDLDVGAYADVPEREDRGVLWEELSDDERVYLTLRAQR